MLVLLLTDITVIFQPTIYLLDVIFCLQVNIKDISGAPIALKEFTIQFKDANEFPPQQTVGLKKLRLVTDELINIYSK